MLDMDEQRHPCCPQPFSKKVLGRQPKIYDELTRAIWRWKDSGSSAILPVKDQFNLLIIIHIRLGNLQRLLEDKVKPSELVLAKQKD